MSTKTELTNALCDELECLWADLEQAIQYALNGWWSLQCDHIQDRIRNLTQLVGPTAWQNVSISLLERGTYQRIHDELGIRVEPDMAVVAEIRERLGR